jgi:hypothetical protein
MTATTSALRQPDHAADATEVSADNWQQIAAACIAAGAPIPTEVFLASHGISAEEERRRSELSDPDAPAITTLDPAKADILYGSREFTSIEKGMAAWVTKQNGRKRPDLFGKANRTVAAILEAELKDAISRAYGSQLGGNAAKGIDVPEWLMDVKTVKSRQSRLRFNCACERALGNGEHDLLLLFKIGKDKVLDIIEVDFLPAWQASDCVASHAAEIARKQVLAGSTDAPSAAAKLVEEGHVPWGCAHLIEALSSKKKIRQGSLTLSMVQPVWQADYRHLVTEGDEGSTVRRVVAPTQAKVASLAAARQRRQRGMTNMEFMVALLAAIVIGALAPVAPGLAVAAVLVGFSTFAAPRGTASLRRSSTRC